MSDNGEVWHKGCIATLEAELAKVRRELRKAEGEVHALQVDRECLLKARAEDSRRNGGFVLPNPEDVKTESYVIALRVGDMPLTIPSFNEPYERPYHYRLHFRKEYSSRGTYWRAEPFCTEPSDGRRR